MIKAPISEETHKSIALSQFEAKIQRSFTQALITTLNFQGGMDFPPEESRKIHANARKGCMKWDSRRWKSDLTAEI